MHQLQFDESPKNPEVILLMNYHNNKDLKIVPQRYSLIEKIGFILFFIFLVFLVFLVISKL